MFFFLFLFISFTVFSSLFFSFLSFFFWRKQNGTFPPLFFFFLYRSTIDELNPRGFFQWGNIDEWFIPARLYNCCQEWDLSFPRFTWDGKRWRNVKASYPYICTRTSVYVRECTRAGYTLYHYIFPYFSSLFFFLSSAAVFIFNFNLYLYFWIPLFFFFLQTFRWSFMEESRDTHTLYN